MTDLQTQRQDARRFLRLALANPLADFHPGQWEAIDALVNRREKLLVVQRTGWGKSMVYFIATRLLRDRGSGPTLIVSPLLALMRNQIEAAERLGIRALTINSANRNDWPPLIRAILNDEADAVLISPERLANDEFVRNVLMPIAQRLGLLVVDEAHCISDWGHDFRPDYRRLVNVLRRMPPNMSLLGTTATANNRVLQDIGRQLGDIQVQRGSLMRETLALQTLRLPDQAARYLRHSELPLECKKQVANGAFAVYPFRGNLAANLRAETGRVLSRWGDAGWGQYVAEDKRAGHFRDELVDAMAEMIQQRWRPQPAPTWVTCVPSRNHPTLVPDFARRLAARLRLPFIPAVVKQCDNQLQKLQQNRYHQCRNLDGVFAVAASMPSGPVLLVDGMVDSAWTLTVVAALLRQAGSGPVWPTALATTAGGGD